MQVLVFSGRASVRGFSRSRGWSSEWTSRLDACSTPRVSRIVPPLVRIVTLLWAQSCRTLMALTVCGDDGHHHAARMQDRKGPSS